MKHLLRKKILALRESQPASTKNKKDKKIMASLFEFHAFKKSKEIFTYLSHRGEVSADRLIKKYFKRKKIIVPAFRGESLCLYELKGINEYRKGRYGIREPMHCLLKKERGKIDLALIPGIAFDKTGHRIGFGGGHFDRLLKKLHCVTVGLAYEFQIIDKVPTQSYDVPVDYLITEKRTIPCQRYRNKIKKSTKSSKAK